MNAAAKFAGSFAYSPAAGTVLAAGTHTLSVTFTPADTSLYTTATASTTLVVTVPRTTPTVSWATPAAITQGTALSATQLNATASVPGTFLYAPAAGTVLAAGTHTLGATFTPADTTRYTTATASTTLAVTAPPTAPTVSWRSPAAITQGTPLGATQLNATASVPGTFAYTPAAGIYLAAGTHMLRATFTPADTVRYTSTTAMTALVVNPPPFQLTVLRPTGGTISAAALPAVPGAPTARRPCRWRSGSGSGRRRTPATPSQGGPETAWAATRATRWPWPVLAPAARRSRPQGSPQRPAAPATVAAGATGLQSVSGPGYTIPGSTAECARPRPDVPLQLT